MRREVVAELRQGGLSGPELRDAADEELLRFRSLCDAEARDCAALVAELQDALDEVRQRAARRLAFRGGADVCSRALAQRGTDVLALAHRLEARGGEAAHTVAWKTAARVGCAPSAAASAAARSASAHLNAHAPLPRHRDDVAVRTGASGYLSAALAASVAAGVRHAGATAPDSGGSSVYQLVLDGTDAHAPRRYLAESPAHLATLLEVPGAEDDPRVAEALAVHALVAAAEDQPTQSMPNATEPELTPMQSAQMVRHSERGDVAELRRVRLADAPRRIAARIARMAARQAGGADAPMPSASDSEHSESQDTESDSESGSDDECLGEEEEGLLVPPAGDHSESDEPPPGFTRALVASRAEALSQPPGLEEAEEPPPGFELLHSGVSAATARGAQRATFGSPPRDGWPSRKRSREERTPFGDEGDGVGYAALRLTQPQNSEDARMNSVARLLTNLPQSSTLLPGLVFCTAAGQQSRPYTCFAMMARSSRSPPPPGFFWRAVVSVPPRGGDSGGARVNDVPHPFISPLPAWCRVDARACVNCAEFLVSDPAGEEAYRPPGEQSDTFCRCCGDGGDVLVCDKKACGRCNCQACVIRLMGKPEVRRIKGLKDWRCWMCGPEALKATLQAKANEAAAAEAAERESGSV